MTPEQLAAEYELRLNAHDAEQVTELLGSDAIFWFNDGSHEGIAAIEQALSKTWETIREEKYQIHNIRWIGSCSDLAVCIYEFRWKGLIDGQETSGWGRGTSVLKNAAGSWKIVHEHLSTPQ